MGGIVKLISSTSTILNTSGFDSVNNDKKVGRHQILFVFDLYCSSSGGR